MDQVAGNGLLDRRLFLHGGGAVAGAFTTFVGASAAQGAPLAVPEWMKEPGAPVSNYGQPSRFESDVIRTPLSAASLTAVGPGATRTPLQHLNGIITPNGLFFERIHNGIPDIDPAGHRLLIHGLVKRPLTFSLEALARYPMTSRIAFIECSGNSAAMFAKEPAAGGAQGIHGLVSCAEWSGVMLSVLLGEAGVDPKARWLLAEGADAAGMSRSVPLAKAFDDAMIALYQNGERIRPSNGYPMRLLLPGFEGNMNVKWLRRLKLTEAPTMTKDETSKYSILLKDGRVAQLVFAMDVKSVITQPSPGLNMAAAGLYEISGLAWSGHGKIARVEVSADGGASWAEAALAEPVLSKALTRFRAPWRWSGGPATLISRATDDTGSAQPSRAHQIERRGAKATYHCNFMTCWGVSASGEVKHVYI
jgi:sulfane dehydrogenase subunit SoxC